MRHEQIEHLGHGVERRLGAQGDPFLAVEPGAELGVECIVRLPPKPGAQRIGQDNGFRCTGLGRQRIERQRQVVRQIELVADLAGLHETSLGWIAYPVDGADRR